jgi:RNA polymerase sigma-70 factor (family 1)
LFEPVWCNKQAGSCFEPGHFFLLLSDMSRARKTDNSLSLKELFNDNFRALCYFAFTYLKDQQASEDVVQDAFEALWDSYDKVSDSPKIRLSWLYNTVRNKCLNVLRHRKVEEMAGVLMAHDMEEWHESDYHRFIKSEVYKELYNAIEKLPPECRKIYKMNYFFKMTEKEIAETLSLSVNSVKSQKQRGKELLRRMLGRLVSVLLVV